MLLDFALLAVATIGSKLLLGFAAMYYMLPLDVRCVACDGETVPLTPLPGFAALGRWLHIQRRWCLKCQKITLVRGCREPRVWVGPAPERETAAPHPR